MSDIWVSYDKGFQNSKNWCQKYVLKVISRKSAKLAVIFYNSGQMKMS